MIDAVVYFAVCLERLAGRLDSDICQMQTWTVRDATISVGCHLFVIEAHRAMTNCARKRRYEGLDDFDLQQHLCESNDNRRMVRQSFIVQGHECHSRCFWSDKWPQANLLAD